MVGQVKLLSRRFSINGWQYKYICASGFAEKVLGNVDTQHKILIPNASALSLAQQDCSPVSPLQPPISEDDAKALMKKAVGWRLLDEEGGLELQCLWKLRDFRSGVELINLILKVTEATGHFPSLHLEEPNQVRAELLTASIGLTISPLVAYENHPRPAIAVYFT